MSDPASAVKFVAGRRFISTPTGAAFASEKRWRASVRSPYRPLGRTCGSHAVQTHTFKRPDGTQRRESNIATILVGGRGAMRPNTTEWWSSPRHFRAYVDVFAEIARLQWQARIRSHLLSNRRSLPIRLSSD